MSTYHYHRALILTQWRINFLFSVISKELLQMNFYLINFSHLFFPHSSSLPALFTSDISFFLTLSPKNVNKRKALEKIKFASEKKLWDILSSSSLPSPSLPHHKFKWAKPFLLLRYSLSSGLIISANDFIRFFFSYTS